MVGLVLKDLKSDNDQVIKLELNSLQDKILFQQLQEMGMLAMDGHEQIRIEARIGFFTQI